MNADESDLEHILTLQLGSGGAGLAHGAKHRLNREPLLHFEGDADMLHLRVACINLQPFTADRPYVELPVGLSVLLVVVGNAREKEIGVLRGFDVYSHPRLAVESLAGLVNLGSVAVTKEIDVLRLSTGDSGS